MQDLTKIFCIFSVILFAFGCRPPRDIIDKNSQDRIYGMLIGAAVADAMAGPHEGRSTEESQMFLKEGGWINSFDTPYSRWYQSHWNVYEQGAYPGTYTDDTRLRLFIAETMIGSGDSGRLDKNVLAQQVFKNYSAARTQYVDSEKDVLKENFLEMWFWWELTKLATSVYVPVPAISSPPAEREEFLDEKGDRTGYWKINKREPLAVNSNLKLDWHDGSYRDGKEWPMGQIALLPLAAYFAGEPQGAFQYVVEIDFLDVGNAPLYPAFVAALIADGLGGREWTSVKDELLEFGVGRYVRAGGGLNVAILEPQVTSALNLSAIFRRRDDYPSRNNYRAFVEALHASFAIGTEYDMCTCEEMLTVPLAIADYSMELGLKAAIEYGVNYGRDNDTVASFVATLVGAYMGKDDLPDEWIDKVISENQSVSIEEVSNKLAAFIKPN